MFGATWMNQGGNRLASVVHLVDANDSLLIPNDELFRDAVVQRHAAMKPSSAEAGQLTEASRRMPRVTSTSRSSSAAWCSN